MILAVIGSRSIKNIDIASFIPEGEIELIVSGGAVGVDRAAEEYAREKGIAVKVIKPDYDSFGKRAPLIRDEEIAECADKILAIWDGRSGGTMYTVKYARSLGKKVILWKLSESQPDQISLW